MGNHLIEPIRATQRHLGCLQKGLNSAPLCSQHFKPSPYLINNCDWLNHILVRGKSIWMGRWPVPSARAIKTWAARFVCLLANKPYPLIQQLLINATLPFTEVKWVICSHVTLPSSVGVSPSHTQCCDSELASLQKAGPVLKKQLYNHKPGFLLALFAISLTTVLWKNVSK